jgi:NAD(P)-dependent dehydrogenase (short-subunit alcohol dehydrogenase family)
VIALVGGGGIAEGIANVVPGCVTTQGINVQNFDSVDRWFQANRPETVIVTAGVSHPATVADSSPSDWVAEIETNLIGSYFCAEAGITHGTRTFIFIASVSGKYGKPNHSGYCASKAGVISLVQSMAMEGHDCYAISPGRVDTKMREHDYPGEDPRTRLHPTQIGEVAFDILAGGYRPGDNIVIRRIGFETFLRVDQGAPWRDWLKVGQPVTL